MFNMTLIVLGAGATRGASFVNDPKEDHVCQPPLNTDFFTQIQKIFDKKYQKDILTTIEFTCDIFGKNFRLTMEELFTQIEFMLKSFRLVKAGRRQSKIIKKLRILRASLLQSIFAILEKSVHEVKKENICTYHKHLIESLKPDDTIITFNYDCLVDITLKEFGNEKWHPRWGYVFPYKNYGSPLGSERWRKNGRSKKIRASKKSTIKLLKLHGSINWDITEPKRSQKGGMKSKGKIKLKERLWSRGGKTKFTIIPPEWNKDIAETGSLFNRIWTEAANRIRKERTFVFIGFSFTPTDLHAAALFQVAVKKVNRLIIVNPDPEARHRTRKILSTGIDNKTVMIQFDKLEEFAKRKERILSCFKSEEEPEKKLTPEKNVELTEKELAQPQAKPALENI